MPMCRSPKIPEVLLRAKTTPANDNYTPVDKRMKSFGATWRTLLISFCIVAGAVFVFGLLSHLFR